MREIFYSLFGVQITALKALNDTRLIYFLSLLSVINKNLNDKITFHDNGCASFRDLARKQKRKPDGHDFSSFPQSQQLHENLVVPLVL